MSHKATNWAIQQRGISPAQKLVLWHLCDRFNEDNGCFPSQLTLAGDCELSRSSLNDQLAALEAAGKMLRQKRRDQEGRQLRTRYRFPFEAGWPFSDNVVDDGEPEFAGVEQGDQVGEPSPKFGHGAESETGGEPSPKSTENRVQTVGLKPGIEPGNNQEERAREKVDEDDGKSATGRTLITFRGRWPTSHADDRERVERAWQKLTPLERDKAIDYAETMAAEHKRTGIGRIMPGWRYLENRQWQTADELAAEAAAQPEEAAPPARTHVEAFTRAWWSVWLLARVHHIRRDGLLLASKMAGLAQMHAIGTSCDGAEAAAAQALEPTLAPVMVDSDEFKQWAAFFYRADKAAPEAASPMPRPNKADRIFMPWPAPPPEWGDLVATLDDRTKAAAE